MKYSVIVPCYNTASTLETTIKSIRSSGLTDYEILLVDDGSKDGTPALCDRLAAEHADVRCIHKGNGGVSSTRNRGLEEAQGEYVWFFDADDLVDKDSMKRAAQIIDAYAPDMLMFGMSFDYYAGKRMYRRLELHSDIEGILAPADLNAAFSELYHNNMLTPCWNKLIRRRVLTENGIRFHEDMFVMEDFLFSLEAMRYCETVYTIPQVIYRYNQGDAADADRAALRLQRVKDLPAYLKPFDDALSGHPEVLTALFFGLLRQKLSIQTPEEMRETAGTVCDSAYAVGRYRDYQSQSDRKLIQDLQGGNYDELCKTNKKGKRRSALISAVKRSGLYAAVRGCETKRVVW